MTTRPCSHAAVLLLLLAPLASAGLIIGTLPVNDGSGRGFSNNQAMAVGFLMVDDYEFTSATLRLRPGNVALPTSTVTVAIYDNSGSNEPGTLLSTLSGLGGGWIDATPNNYTFTSPTPLTLQSGSVFWLVLHYTSFSSFTWIENFPYVDPSGPGATYFDTTFYNPFPATDNDTFERMAFSIDGNLLSSPVPEPGSLTLGAIGALVIAGGLRRRAKRTPGAPAR